MPVTTYLNGERLNAMLVLEDESLNRLYQAARAYDPRLYIKETTVYDKPWFKAYRGRRVYETYRVADKTFTPGYRDHVELGAVHSVQIILAGPNLQYQGERTEVLKYLEGFLHGVYVGKGE